MTREKLKNRRDSVLVEFDHGGIGHTLTVGFYDDVEKTRVAEVFIDCHKRATGMADNARDAATTASIALQHGAPLLVIYDALNRYETGEAAGVLGSALDTLKTAMPDLFLP